MRTQVGIVGAGPAGLMLAHLLRLGGIESVVLEAHSRDHIESRVRAGVLEQTTVDLMKQTGVADRLQREGLLHHGLWLSFGGHRHHINLFELTGGRAITVYGQHEVIKDLVRARLDTGRPIFFESEAVTLQQINSEAPEIHFRKAGQEERIVCDFIAGCDGFHGICRSALPEDSLRIFDQDHSLGWLGILALAPPSSEEIVYAYHDRGFALFSMRSPEVTRLYLQCDREEDILNWPDDRIWEELLIRLTTKEGWAPNKGAIIHRSIIGLRGFVAEPMQSGRLFLAGDAAHILPPTGAKGLNLAIADVAVLARAIMEFYKSGRRDLLDRYSEVCLRRVWKVQRFASWMTSALHRFRDDNPFNQRRQLAELDYVVSSRAAMTSFAENYVGLPLQLEA